MGLRQPDGPIRSGPSQRPQHGPGVLKSAANSHEDLKSLHKTTNVVLVGGAMAYAFLKADGQNVGASRVEEDLLDMAAELLASYGDRLLLPTDHVIADEPHAAARVEMAAGGIPEGWYGMDIDSRSIGRFLDEIQQAGTIIWNGPLGKFEDKPFQSGTQEVNLAIAASSAMSYLNLEVRHSRAGGNLSLIHKYLELPGHLARHLR